MDFSAPDWPLVAVDDADEATPLAFEAGGRGQGTVDSASLNP